MATSEISAVIQHLRGVVLRWDVADLTDGQLLEEYLRRQDEAALAALVRRHGPMVWGVCRRFLGNYHDAEDAFQATFLVLVRRASSIVPRVMVANWLYGVARQTALKARTTTARRNGRERQVAEMPEPAVPADQRRCDLQPLLDEEISRLPDRYRAVIVLCDLEGKTRKEAARQLGRPEGTVAGWLARARKLLAKRLARHGLAVPSGALVTLLAPEMTSATVPASVLYSTIKAVTLLAAGQAVASSLISVNVAALMEGVLKTMLFTKLKTVTAVLVMAGMVGVGSGVLTHTRATGQQPSHIKTEEAKREGMQDAAADAPKATGIPSQRAPEEIPNAAAIRAECIAYRESFLARFAGFAAGKTTVPDYMLDALRRLEAAELKACTTPAERVEVLERCCTWAKVAESISKPKFDAGVIGPASYYPVVRTREDLEGELADQSLATGRQQSGRFKTEGVAREGTRDAAIDPKATPLPSRREATTPDPAALRSERLAYRESFQTRFSEFAAGKTTAADYMLDALLRLTSAELKGRTAPVERVEVLASSVAWAKAAEVIQKVKFDAGVIGPANYYPVRAARVDLECKLAEARKE